MNRNTIINILSFYTWNIFLMNIARSGVALAIEFWAPGSLTTIHLPKTDHFVRIVEHTALHTAYFLICVLWIQPPLGDIPSKIPNFPFFCAVKIVAARWLLNSDALMWRRAVSNSLEIAFWYCTCCTFERILIQDVKCRVFFNSWNFRPTSSIVPTQVFILPFFVYSMNA